MVFIFQETLMQPEQKKSRLPKVAMRETVVIDLNKLNALLKGGESGYTSNDLAAKQTSIKKLTREKVPELALFCVQQFINDWSSGNGTKSIMDGTEYKGFAKNIGKANYNVDLNDLRKALVAEFQKYFPSEKLQCQMYVNEKVIPYLNSLQP